MRRTAVVLVAVLGVGAAPARASFAPPVALTAPASPIAPAIVADTDAAGTTTAMVGSLVFERARGGSWSAAARLSGRPRGVAGPVVDAAGDGALGIAWRVDVPRRYGGIAVALRDPGGALSDPMAIAGDDAGGTRHPALTIDARGDALLAYDTGTRASHLSIQGRIAVAYRRAGGAFSTPVVVDSHLAGPPVVALAPDGTGIVAWIRDRRIRAVSIDADGRIGKAKGFAAAGRSAPVVAAGANGAATIAWTSHHELGGRRGARYVVRALRRGPGRAFAAAQTIASTPDFVPAVSLAADDDGRVTLAWSAERFRTTRGSAIYTATARTGRPFAAPRTIVAHQGERVGPPAIAGAGGRVAVAWSSVAGRRRVGVQAAVGPATDPGPPQTVASVTLSGNFFRAPPAVAATLDGHGPATVLFAQPVEQPKPAGLAWRLMASDGS